MENYSKIISEKLNSLSVSDFGFADVHELKSEITKDLPYAISVVIKLSDYVVDGITDKPTYSYFQHYRTVNAFIDRIILEVGLLIEKLGYKYMPVAASQSIPDAKVPYSGIISHKAAARLAGLGIIGKHDLFISNKFGPRIRLGTILTDMPLDACKSPMTKSICGECNICKSSCPAMAITGAEWSLDGERESLVDARACSEYMKNKFQKIGRGSVCGICMKVCPGRNKI